MASVYGSSRLYDLGSHTVPVGAGGAGVGGGERKWSRDEPGQTHLDSPCCGGHQREEEREEEESPPPVAA